MNPKHSIKAVANSTGIAPYLIRVWERRYKAVTPSRTSTGRRLYTDEDIERLALLKQACKQGESIGQIATLPREELLKLTGGQRNFSQRSNVHFWDPGIKAEDFLEQAIERVHAIDASGLEHILSQAEAALSRPILLEGVYRPLLYQIGASWSDGGLKVVQEHTASAIIATLLGNMFLFQRPYRSAPALVVATPVGQLHEFGALMVAITAVSHGWNVIYVGRDIEAAEIAEAARVHHARAVALSLVYPADDPHLLSELRKLRGLLGAEVGILVGGQAAAAYVDILTEVKAPLWGDLNSAVAHLDSIRAAIKG